MKKEVIIAIIIGFSLGLIVTYGIKTAQKSLDARNALTSPEANNNTLTAQNSEVVGHTVLVNSPQPNSIIEEDKTLVTGSTTPLSLISVLSSANEYATSMADDQGNFSVSLPLSVGVNQITIQSYIETAPLAESQVFVVHSTYDLDQDTAATESANQKKATNE